MILTSRIRSCVLFFGFSLVGWQGFAVDYDRDVFPILEKYCHSCHGPEKQKSDVRLDTLSSDLLADRRSAETWHDVLDTLNLGEMPPEDETQLTDEERKTLIGWLTESIENAARKYNEEASTTVLRRLNRVEYNHTMRDLLGIEDDYARNLPPDSASHEGFLNNGSVLSISDLQLEYYLDAARKALARVIVTSPEPEVIRAEFTKTVKDKGRGVFTERLGEVGTFVSRLTEYPEEGEFRLRIRARAVADPEKDFPRLSVLVGYRADTQAPSLEMARFDVTSETAEVYELTGRIEQFPLPSVTQSKYPGLLIRLQNVLSDPSAQKGNKNKQKSAKGSLIPEAVIESLEFEGPIFDQWPPEHHRAILFASDQREQDEAAYAREVIARFVARAFRRPVSEEEVDVYFAYYQSVRSRSDSLEVAMREALAMVLVSPDFLYLVEPSAGDGKKRRLTDHEIASRLSYFLHATMPDARLREKADAGALQDPVLLREEARRLLGDEKVFGFIQQFTDQWLDLGAVDRVAVNPEYYPEFKDEIKADLQGEPRHFFAEILREDLSALNLIDSDFTMLNAPLARHYGIPGPRSSAFEKVALPVEARRGGLLTQGAILLGNSTGTDSHPIQRAVWLRERLLDDPPAPPPPNVPTLDEEDPNFAKLSVKAQLELHREDAACMDCHEGIDPWGVALEEFGGDGLWRDEILRKEKVGKRLKDLRVPVESAAVLPDGTEVTGAEDLKEYLLEHQQETFSRALVSRMLSFALGRSLHLGDDRVVDELTKRFSENDYRLSDLIEEIVVSEPFLTK